MVFAARTSAAAIPTFCTIMSDC